jgi:transposase
VGRGNRLKIPTRFDLLTRVFDLDNWNRSLREQNARLEEQNAALRAEVLALKTRIEELERRLDQTSQNSSRPPSSDPPHAAKLPKKPPTGRKPGGQPGHPPHQRMQLPPERVNQREDVWPVQCENCKGDLSREGMRVEVGEPERHQVAEIAIEPAQVTEFVLHSQQCPDCEHTTAAKIPPGVPMSNFGPRLQGAMSVLSGAYRLGKRGVQSLLRDLFKIDISLGAISACEQRTSETLAAPVAEAHAYVQNESVGGADETGWTMRRAKAWLWVFVTAQVTVFMIHAHRGSQAARKLLGRFSGILNSDRWCAYVSYQLGKRQLCWAHLRRHFVFFSEHSGKAGRIGSELLTLTDQMFQWWHRVRDGTMSRSTFQRKMLPVRRRVERLLSEGTYCTKRKVEAMCREILALRRALWTFLRVEAVEPTNNAAERAIRPAVLYRRTSHGTHSEDGSRFIERMLTVTATLKQQGRNVFDYVTEACERALLGQRPRSLLPGGRIMTGHALRLARSTP